MAESKIPYQGLVIKSKTFSGTPNTGGGLGVGTPTSVSSTRYVSIKSTTPDRILLDLGNGYALVVNNSLQVQTSGTVSGILYYV